MEPIDTSLTWAIYKRKSSEDKERQFLSISSQDDKIREKFPEIDFQKDLDFEESRSAFTPYCRPEFDRIVGLIERGRVDALAAYHPNRISRNEIEAAIITYLLRQGKLKDLKFTTFNFENTPSGIWMLQMMLSHGQYESARLGIDVQRGMMKKANAGWKPNRARVGYRNSGATSQKGMRYIKNDPKRFKLVREAWDLLLTGNYTVPEIASIAEHEWKLKMPKTLRQGNTPVSKQTWYHVFRDIFYAGWFYYKDESEPRLGAHNAMITLEEYNQAQQLLSRRGKPRMTPQRHLSFMGLLRCGECGCAVTGQAVEKPIPGSDGTRMYTYYHCSRKRKDYKCSQKAITEIELESQCKAEIQKYTILPEFRHLALKLLKHAHGDEITTRAQMYETQHKALVQAQKRLDNLIDMRADRDISEKEFKRKNRQYKKEILDCEDLLRNTERRARRWTELTEETFEFATNAHQAFTEGDAEEKKRVLRTLGYNLTLIDKKLHIEAKKWFIPIAKGYPKLEAKYLEVITTKNPSMKEKTAALATISKNWWR